MDTLEANVMANGNLHTPGEVSMGVKSRLPHTPIALTYMDTPNTGEKNSITHKRCEVESRTSTSFLSNVPPATNLPMTCTLLRSIDMLTPPTSAETVLLPGRLRSETPRSHYQSSFLPREFKSKCSINVHCDETPNLASIKEEPNIEAVTTARLVGSPKRKIHDITWGDTSKKNNAKPMVTPKKKRACTKVLRTSFDQLGQVQKENSPIKVESSFDIGSCFMNKSAGASHTFILKPPPFKLNSLGRPGDNCYKDVICGLGRIPHLIQKILSYLGPLDLVNFMAVSKSWYNLTLEVSSHQKISKARMLAVTTKENTQVELRQATRSRNETTPRKFVLPELSDNHILSPKRRGAESPKLSPRSKRFCNYVREGRALGKTGRLARCPKCGYSARVLDLSASCTDCHFTFCVQCHCAPHSNNSCNFVIALSSSPSPRKSTTRYAVGSKASKKALRRL